MRTNKFGIAIPDDLHTAHELYKQQGHVNHWEYCKTDTLGMPEEVVCKECGERIVGIRDWGDPEVYISGDEPRTMVIKQRVRVMPFDNYAMVRLEMEDGSSHITPCCKKCAEEIRNAHPDKLQAIYISDLHSLSDTATTDRDIEVVKKFHARKTVGVS